MLKLHIKQVTVLMVFKLRLWLGGWVVVISSMKGRGNRNLASLIVFLVLKYLENCKIHKLYCINMFHPQSRSPAVHTVFVFSQLNCLPLSLLETAISTVPKSYFIAGARAANQKHLNNCCHSSSDKARLCQQVQRTNKHFNKIKFCSSLIISPQPSS